MDLKKIFTAWVIAHNPTESQQELANKRGEICKDCEFIKSLLSIPYCSECGCPIAKKVFTDTYNPCPKKKWEKIDVEYFGERKKDKTLI